MTIQYATKEQYEALKTSLLGITDWRLSEISGTFNGADVVYAGSKDKWDFLCGKVEDEKGNVEFAAVGFCPAENIEVVLQPSIARKLYERILSLQSKEPKTVN